MTEDSLIAQAQRKQSQLTTHFMQLVQRNRLSHAYLFAGMPGCGKRAVAQVVAMRLFCEQPTDSGLPCGHCAECQRILAGDNPDVVVAVPEGQRIKVDQVRYIKDEFSKSAVEGAMKVFIIEGAETLTTSAANGLLKFIEEPVANRVIFLLTTNKSMMLPTILSRTQVVDFPALSVTEFATSLEKQGVAPNQIQLLSHLTNSIEVVTALTTDDWLSKCQHELSRWFNQLANGDSMSFITVHTGLMPLALDRERQGIILDMIVLLWQETLQAKYIPNEQSGSFPEVTEAITSLSSRVSRQQLLMVLSSALETKKALAGNMNFQSILETLTLTHLTQLKGATL